MYTVYTTSLLYHYYEKTCSREAAGFCFFICMFSRMLFLPAGSARKGYCPAARPFQSSAGK